MPGARAAFSAYRAKQLARAFNSLGPGGPFIADGQRIEDRPELLFVTSGVERVSRKLRTALTDLPEPAAQHVRCALAFAEGALAIREAASSPRSHRRAQT